MQQTTAPALLDTSHESGVTTISRRCEVRTRDGIIVVVVDNAVLMSFEAEDVAARRLAMVLLSERELGNHDHIAAAFGLESLAVDRARKAFQQHGLAGLLPKKRGRIGPRVTGGKTDKVIVAAKRVGQSNTTIAVRLGISEGSVRAALRRLGWKPQQAESLPFSESTPSAEVLEERRVYAQGGADEPAPQSELEASAPDSTSDSGFAVMLPLGQFEAAVV
jgi:hypothetical protein